MNELYFVIVQCNVNLFAHVSTFILHAFQAWLLPVICHLYDELNVINSAMFHVFLYKIKFTFYLCPVSDKRTMLDTKMHY